ncbi:MAG: chemotaxis protein CheW [Sandaracinaceae bacterium]
MRPDTPTRQLCTFQVDDLLFGIPVESVRELMKPQPMTRVPLSGHAVAGLINIRGEIVTALDVRRRLGLAGTETPSMNVVLFVRDELASVLVDKIGDVVEVHDDQFERPPETLRGSVREVIRGAYKLPNRLLLLLDVPRFVEGCC